MTEQPPHDDTAETREVPGQEPGPGSEPPPRRFLRSREDRMLLGVAAGLSTYFGVDATLVRLAFVALTFFGGAGALLYVAAILLVPEAPAGGGTPAPPGSDRTRLLTGLGIVALVLIGGPLLFVPAAITAGIVVPVALLVLVGVAVSWLVTGRRPSREPMDLAKATLIGLGLVVLLVVLSVAAFWAAGLGGDAAVAGLVIAAGLALVAGAFARPVRWLILPALAVALPASFVAAAGVDLGGGFGERSYRPGAAAELAERYELGAGELILDLRQADLPPGDRRLELALGMGEATLIVAEDVCVTTRARVGMGVVRAFGREHAGVDVGVADQDEARAGTARVVLDADVGFGALDVRHTDKPGWEVDEDRGPGRWRTDEDGDRAFEARGDPAGDPAGDAAGNEACAGAAN